jgi:hypothetical protein
VSRSVYHGPFGSPGRFMVTVRSRLTPFIVPNGPWFPYPIILQRHFEVSLED